MAFGAVTTGVAHSRDLTITNDLDDAVEVTAAGFEEDVFSTDLSGLIPIEIPAHDSVNFHVYFSSNQNVDYADFLRIDVNSGTHPLIARVSAEAQYPDAYYAPTQNKWAEELKDALTDLIDGHTSLGYNVARDSMYASIDNVGGWVECVYTGRKAFFNTRAGATANGFNCEHTLPQSFFNDAEPMRSDIFNLYPTDETANNQRANLDFGVVTTITWSNGGSKLGTDSQGQLVFEPRDVHKGNVARTIFYEVIRYNGAYNGWQNATKMEGRLRAWHVSSAVDSAEAARNQHIYTIQHNRNPLIDHPELVDRISSFFGTAVHELVPEIAVAPQVVSLGSIGPDSTVYYYAAVINTGSDTLNVSSITSTDAAFGVNPSSMVLAPETSAYLTISYTSGDVPSSDSASIVLASDDADESEVEIAVTVEAGGCAGVGDGSGTSAEVAQGLRLYQNSPNPFGETTRIAYLLDREEVVSLILYDVRGRLVRTVIDRQVMPAGMHEAILEGGSSLRGLPPGTYYYRLVAGSRVLSKSMVLLAGEK